MAAHGMVRLSTGLFERLKEYSATTDVPMARVANEALADWLETTGTDRLVVLTRRKSKANGEVIVMESGQ